MGKNFKEWSKDNWGLTKDDAKPSDEQIRVGCLQRIADATELIAKNYNDLLREKKRYEQWYRQEREENASLRRSLIAHKANYTRLKNKLEALENAAKNSRSDNRNDEISSKTNGRG